MKKNILGFGLLFGLLFGLSGVRIILLNKDFYEERSELHEKFMNDLSKAKNTSDIKEIKERHYKKLESLN